MIDDYQIPSYSLQSSTGTFYTIDTTYVTSATSTTYVNPLVYTADIGTSSVDQTLYRIDGQVYKVVESDGWSATLKPVDEVENENEQEDEDRTEDWLALLEE